MTFTAFFLVFSLIGVHSDSEQVAPLTSCDVSPLVRDSAAPDPGADPIVSADWYINAARTIWVGPVPSGGWPAGDRFFGTAGKGQKTYWVRPQDTELTISGRRLDATGAPVEARIPCCYRSGFQVVDLYFPTEGCWEVTAKAGSDELRFVTQVRR